MSNKVDIEISSFIEEAFGDVKLFNQHIHPTRMLFEYLAKEVCKRLGLKDIRFAVSEGYLDDISTPIYPSTFKNLGLKFSDENFQYKAAEGKRLSQKEVVESFYRLYGKCDADELLQQIKEKKSFVMNMVDAYTEKNVVNDRTANFLLENKLLKTFRLFFNSRTCKK